MPRHRKNEISRSSFSVLPQLAHCGTRGKQDLDYASWMGTAATLLMWFQLRSPELAEEFERLMAGDRDVVRGSLDTVSDWRLTRPGTCRAVDR